MRKFVTLAALLISVVAAGHLAGCSNTVDNGGGPGPGNGTHNDLELAVIADESAQIDIENARFSDGRFQIPQGGPWEIDASATGFDHPACDIEVSGSVATVSIYHAEVCTAEGLKPEVETFQVMDGGEFQVHLNPLGFDGAHVDCRIVSPEGLELETRWEGVIEQTDGGEVLRGFYDTTAICNDNGHVVGSDDGFSWDLTLGTYQGNQVLEGTYIHPSYGERELRCYLD